MSLKFQSDKRCTQPPGNGLYQPEFERDACGFGLLANRQGQPTHDLVCDAIQALDRMTHRGAVAADGKSGDGCGVLISTPFGFLRQKGDELGMSLDDKFAVGCVFLNPDEELASKGCKQIEQQLVACGLVVAGWRAVPINPDACGEHSRISLPQIMQIYVNYGVSSEPADFHRRLYVARRQAEYLCQNDPYFYIPSLAADTLSYKALVLPENLNWFYPDLSDPQFEATICLFHQRFSTNTWPQWRLAQPFRCLAHNGEINTVQGNRRWARARAAKYASQFLPDLKDLPPLLSDQDSDSASLDNMVELFVAGGLDLFQTMRILIPPAWQNVESMDPDMRAFYQYYALNTDPWDGPGGIVLTDGRFAACVLDRNGLRPARYVLTEERFWVASEVGVVDVAAVDVVEKGRLGPGQMIAVDTNNGELWIPSKIDDALKSRAPYKQWLKEGVQYLEPALRNPQLTQQEFDADRLLKTQRLFNLTAEEKEQILLSLAQAGMEAVGSMGDDTPIAVLSQRVRPLYDYFRQRFAQVTNPPIDPLRESLVMSLETNFGVETNLFETSADQARRLLIESPVLSETKYQKLLSHPDSAYRCQSVSLQQLQGETLFAALERICSEAQALVKTGAARIVVLDDTPNDDPDFMPVHALLAMGAVHHRLVEAGLRCDCNVVVVTATVRDPHHFACLLGYGATAIYPYLAYQTLNSMVNDGSLRINQERVGYLGRNFRKGINKGLYKILSKMGISTMWSYRGSQLFEIIGLSDEVVELCFKGTVSRVQGAGFADLDQDQKMLNQQAAGLPTSLDRGGQLKFVHGGEYHAYHPEVVSTLQAAVKTNDYSLYKQYASVVNNRPVTVLRDLLDFNRLNDPIDHASVESVEAILPRFESAGMSLGALSPEAHEALAIAMNRIGGRSNSGEGGEDPARYGTEKRSKIKQIASGRFGVTPTYLVNAEVLQIKVAQGAKPGEGGQLPGHKVNPLIARLRYANPGIGLISPPPHHDIYSIEDLAQLIFDLKQVNPDALVSVKLVSAPGVGTVAAGVAKAHADLITISGYDGGTGASPLSSVKYAGSPWELGLAETQQVLRANGLRGRIRLQTDGGLKTGLDVVKAAILGAESFGFGTAPMIALGCKYLRICHLNNCATGVATQHDELRRRFFRGLPDMVISYFRFVAEEVREILAQLGAYSLEDVIGKTHLLKALPGQTKKQRGLDLSKILETDASQEFAPRYCQIKRNIPPDPGGLGRRMLQETRNLIIHAKGGQFTYPITNRDRAVGASVSGLISKVHGEAGSPERFLFELNGHAGQSLGAWNAAGVDIRLNGDANDYVGKGMAGGKLTLVPPQGHRYVACDTPIMGNTCLYGATGGELYAAGMAGERFAVRNSGATAVIEGIGDHGCEYMTGGVVAVLGRTGLNFGAGMTGGMAFVLDIEREFVDRYNRELIDIHRINIESMEAYLFYLRSLIEVHVQETGSQYGRRILDDLRDYIGRFWLVSPKAADIHSLLDNLLRAA